MKSSGKSATSKSLDKLTPGQRLSSLLWFGEYYLSSLFRLTGAKMHHDWNDLVQSDKKRLNLQAHRESAKSTFWSIAVPLCQICIWLDSLRSGNDAPDISGAIIGPTDQDARARLRQIKFELEHNALIKRDFNPRPGIRWSDSEIVLDGVMDAKNPTLVASGMLSFQPGARLTFCVLDDVTDPFHVASRLYRDKQIQMLDQVIIPTMREGGVIVAINTTYHNDDFAARLSKDKTWYSQKWPLVIDEGKQLVQWPEAWSWRRVQEIMAKPLIYARQYQLLEQRPEDRRLPMPEYFPSDAVTMDGGAFRIYGERVTPLGAVDPAMTETDDATMARTGIVIGARTKDKKTYILETWAGRVGIDKFFEAMNQLATKWHVKGYWMEKAGFGRVYVTLSEKRCIVPVWESEAKGDKLSRIQGTLNPPMSAHRILLRDHGNEELADEIIDDLAGGTVDCADALEHLERNIDRNPTIAVAHSGGQIMGARAAKKQAASKHTGWLRTKY